MRKIVMHKKVMRVFNNRLMMMIGLSFVIYHLSFSPVRAQTFTQQVQQHRNGEGTVTIHHDADIDRLVNAAPTATKPSANTSKPAATAKPSASAKPATSAKSSTSTKPAASATSAKSAKPAASAKSATSSKPATSAKSTASTAPTKTTSKPKASKTKAETPKAEKSKAEKSKAETPKVERSKAETPKTEKTKTEKSEKQKQPQDDTTQSKPLADTTRTTPQEVPLPVDGDTIAIPTGPRHGYKTTGYRVQAFAGGNTRSDRQKAERTGNAMRQLFPGEDVYVRFYSPRWVCRVGNYRTYEEAHEKMIAIRKMGYESATIVKGKIIVYTTPQQF